MNSRTQHALSVAIASIPLIGLLIGTLAGNTAQAASSDSATCRTASCIAQLREQKIRELTAKRTADRNVLAPYGECTGTLQECRQELIDARLAPSEPDEPAVSEPAPAPVDAPDTVSQTPTPTPAPVESVPVPDAEPAQTVIIGWPVMTAD